MEKYSQVFDGTVQTANRLKNAQNDLCSALILLSQEVDYHREHCRNLENQLESLTENGSFSLTTQNVSLKEINNQLREENERLKNDKTDLNLELLAETQELRKSFESEARKIIEQHRNDVKMIQNELQEVKQKSKMKEENLYNEIQLIQASSALNIDELQTDLRDKLNETSKQLSKALKTSNNLRTELRLLREEYSCYKNTTNLKNVELKRRCEYAEEQLKLHSSSENVSHSRTTSYYTSENRESTVQKRYNIKESGVNRYRPVCEANLSDNFHDETPIHPRFGRNDHGMPSDESVEVPKKRKLYTPDDLSYRYNIID